jgi:hypothetical protein
MTAGYFNRIPYLTYDLSGKNSNNPMVVKNIFFRVAILNSVLNNTLVYYPYYVQSGETPETIAYRYYKDVTKHWVVMMANKIVNPFYDWPLADEAFVNYITNKYGSIAQAQNLINGYTQTVTTTNSNSDTVSTNTFNIDLDTYNNTPATSFQTINLQDGSAVFMTTTTNIVYTWDYENNLNEEKKNIILIDQNYIAQIDQEFTNIINGGS